MYEHIPSCTVKGLIRLAVNESWADTVLNPIIIVCQGEGQLFDEKKEPSADILDSGLLRFHIIWPFSRLK